MYKISEALGLTEIGKRSANEDAIYPILVKDEMTTELKKQVPEIEGLYVVCDGVGGANKGEIAAFLTTVNFPVYFANRKPVNTALSQPYLQDGVRFIEKALDTFTEQNPYAAGMACTLTLLYFNEFGANIGWAGDSRVYHIRAGKILYQTYDHSYVNELLKMGQITEEEAQTHKQKNVILRAIQGTENPTEIEIHAIPWAEIQTGDSFFLCTDGITETFSNEKIAISFETHQHLEHLLSTISQNCELHSRDNYSCYLVGIGEKIAQIEETQTAFLPPIPVETPQIEAIQEPQTMFLETSEKIDVPEIEDEVIATEPPIIEMPIIKEEIRVSAVEIPVLATYSEPVEIKIPEVELPAVSIPIEKEPVAEVPPVYLPENEDKTATYNPEHIASMLDKIQANLPNVPHIEEQKPVIEPKIEMPIIAEMPPQMPPKVETPPYSPPPSQKKGFPMLMFLAGAALIVLIVCAVLWYYIYGPGTENRHFRTYYENAQAKVKECETNGRCLEAKGAVNQANDAAETPEEFKKVQALTAIIHKKEDEVKQKDRLLSPEPMDKGKMEGATPPKTGTPTPKSPANVPPVKDTKPADTKVTPPPTVPPKTEPKPVENKGTTTPPKTDNKGGEVTSPPKTDTKTGTTPPKPIENKGTTSPKPPQGIKVGEPAPPTTPPKPPKGGE